MRRFIAATGDHRKSMYRCGIPTALRHAQDGHGTWLAGAEWLRRRCGWRRDRLSIYTAFDYKEAMASRSSYMGSARLLFPGFVHDVVWEPWPVHHQGRGRAEARPHPQTVTGMSKPTSLSWRCVVLTKQQWRPETINSVSGSAKGIQQANTGTQAKFQTTHKSKSTHYRKLHSRGPNRRNPEDDLAQARAEVAPTPCGGKEKTVNREQKNQMKAHFSSHLSARSENPVDLAYLEAICVATERKSVAGARLPV